MGWSLLERRIDKLLFMYNMSIAVPATIFYVATGHFPWEQRKEEPVAYRMMRHEIAARECERADSIGRLLSNNYTEQPRGNMCRLKLHEPDTNYSPIPIVLQR